MFLDQLPTRLHKALFLELAMLVMMASHDDDASEQISEFTSDEVLKKFLASISSKEAEMLQEYQNELFKSSKNDADFNSDFIELSLNQQYRAFDSSLNASFTMIQNLMNCMQVMILREKMLALVNCWII